ncbi:unnamed protein product [Protopolystoma xenopodis]|uniref:Uncharacterized protein n=1 Tax=Protopolystoma xenopodis TaxID=117903 RepID=A0A448WCQ5_9PLAT|nr:unnamed protein product [Protopolystoma xenopodis]
MRETRADSKTLLKSLCLRVHLTSRHGVYKKRDSLPAAKASSVTKAAEIALAVSTISLSRWTCFTAVPIGMLIRLAGYLAAIVTGFLILTTAGQQLGLRDGVKLVAMRKAVTGPSGRPRDHFVLAAPDKCPMTTEPTVLHELRASLDEAPIILSARLLRAEDPNKEWKAKKALDLRAPDRGGDEFERDNSDNEDLQNDGSNTDSRTNRLPASPFFAPFFVCRYYTYLGQNLASPVVQRVWDVETRGGVRHTKEETVEDWRRIPPENENIQAGPFYTPAWLFSRSTVRPTTLPTEAEEPRPKAPLRGAGQMKLARKEDGIGDEFIQMLRERPEHNLDSPVGCLDRYTYVQNIKFILFLRTISEESTQRRIYSLARQPILFSEDLERIIYQNLCPNCSKS